MYDEKQIINKCNKSISKLFKKEEKRYIYYENFINMQTYENLYNFLKNWNQAIGILNNYEIRLKKALNKLMKKRNIYKFFLYFPFVRNLIFNIIYKEIYNELYYGINKEKKLRIPTVKIAHILYPDFFPMFDNKILDSLVEKKNFLQNKDINFLKEIIFLYKDCIDINNKYNLSYKKIDEYFYLKYTKKINFQKEFNIVCFKLYEEFENNLKKCLKNKLKNRSNF